MGMFDTVRCEYLLPEPTFQNMEYQTKDLGEALGRYIITKDGRLLRFRHPTGIFNDETLRSAETVPAGTEEIAYHGDIRIYSFTEGNDRIELAIRFTHDGRVEWLRPIAA